MSQPTTSSAPGSGWRTEHVREHIGLDVRMWTDGEEMLFEVNAAPLNIGDEGRVKGWPRHPRSASCP